MVVRPAKKISVVVPCFNEELVVEAFYVRMAAACEATVGDSYEIIFVNDGSSDNTMAVIEELAQKSQNVVGLDLFRNHGHQLAVTAGLQFAEGERILLIDADLQDPPELLGAFVKKMDEGYDVVYGQRINRTGETLFKRVTAALFYRGLTRIADTPIPLDSGDFRLMTKEVVHLLNEMPENDRFLRGMVAWIGGRQIALQYKRAPREAGKTKYTLAKMMSLALDAITGFSVTPLRIAIYTAFVAMAVALLLAVYVIVSYFIAKTTPGWASLGVILLVFSALQLFSIGILGEYIGRSYMQAKGRPLTIVRRVVRQPVTQPLGGGQ